MVDYHISDITFAMRNPLQITPDASAAADTGSDESSSDTTTDTTEASTESTESGADNSTDDGTESGPVTGYYASIGVAYDASYDGLKDMLAYVNEYSDRMIITDFNSSMDSETGRLSGQMTFNMFIITNTGKEYVEPKFDFMLKGVQNIFGKNVGTSSDNNN